MHKSLFLSLFFCLFSLEAQSFDACFDDAGRRFEIDPNLLRAIAHVESSMNPTAINDRGSERDIGLMQINSWWLPHLKRFGIAEKDLFHACTNIEVGSWILSENIKRHGARWDSVGVYNVGTGRGLESLKRDYVNRVYEFYSRLQ
ncbi:lytic transglycosylase domain-containing protein (plasmid) [Bermanella marisrubri]|uniref:Putative PilT protein n=1 Tax=Bermanella marisrubri TaxID=207949 RepID=Q1MXI6_9GAMM|nr:lytic transglycosylase domain-containing protein [Bermanella marisrubri]EAT10686.1 putative PilT protein [Oceanobacter sp. RED65] [Bermanella marisrubri]QIZ85902.1 lytic transglycosylase domain-containing protein [Bermanella marisrubri]